MKIAFTGTRKGLTLSQREELTTALTHLTQNGPAEFLHGDCVGADAEAHEIAAKLGLTILKYPSNISFQRAFTVDGCIACSPRPPIERNRSMVDAADILIAAPAEDQEKLRSGTWATIRYARSRIPIKLILP